MPGPEPDAPQALACSPNGVVPEICWQAVATGTAATAVRALLAWEWASSFWAALRIGVQPAFFFFFKMDRESKLVVPSPDRVTPKQECPVLHVANDSNERVTGSRIFQ